ncbi:hypothetical protein J8273_1927 [Carpediemonas membranifera]|uniref:Uncharacterized protein n=1 Tax=Carpediemonas membranifera TaxID=201153 RepID=A0A8J6EBD1_9EUKA|nr:hypothetical protein J8273_1927 [Carpediemonas membranifera]|eukprot:KAG9396880.1 hypothetical protein J8273_1927 [Carpediemonas membranifera]
MPAYHGKGPQILFRDNLRGFLVSSSKKGQNRCARDVADALVKVLEVDRYYDTEDTNMEPNDPFAYQSAPLRQLLRDEEASFRDANKNRNVFRLDTSCRELFFVGWHRMDSEPAELDPDALLPLLFEQFKEGTVVSPSTGRIMPVQWTGSSMWDGVLDVLQKHAIPTITASHSSDRIAIVIKSVNCNNWRTGDLYEEAKTMLPSTVTVVEDYHSPDAVLHIHAVGGSVFVAVSQTWADYESWRVARWCRIAKSEV